jgi:hypothetical protein
MKAWLFWDHNVGKVIISSSAIFGNEIFTMDDIYKTQIATRNWEEGLDNDHSLADLRQPFIPADKQHPNKRVKSSVPTTPISSPKIKPALRKKWEVTKINAPPKNATRRKDQISRSTVDPIESESDHDNSTAFVTMRDASYYDEYGRDFEQSVALAILNLQNASVTSPTFKQAMEGIYKTEFIAAIKKEY